MLLGCHVQPSQFFAAGFWQPSHDRGNISAAQGLFRGPQAGSRFFSGDTQHFFRRQALCCQTGAKRLVRCPDQHHRPRLLHHSLFKCGEQQLPDMLGRIPLQQLHHASHRPTPARKHLVQAGVPGRHYGLFTGKVLHPPYMGQAGWVSEDRRGKLVHGNCGNTGYLYSISLAKESLPLPFSRIQSVGV